MKKNMNLILIIFIFYVYDIYWAVLFVVYLNISFSDSTITKQKKSHMFIVNLFIYFFVK